MGLLEAVEALLRRGFHPNRTLYLGFGEDEEILGQHGAPRIAALLKSRGIELEFVLDEGLVVTDGIVPNISKPAALIGIAEKGYVGMELSVEKIGGHVAMPPQQTAIGILSTAVSRIENHPVPARVDSPVFQTLDALSPDMPAWIRLAVKARRVTAGLLFKVLSRLDSTNATIRTTSAFTIFQAGELVNVLAAKAKADVLFFLLPGDSIASINGYVRRVIADSRIQINVHTQNCAEASPVSPSDSPGYRFIEASIRKTFPGVLVAPGIMTAPTDCRNYTILTKNCYRFSPVWTKPEDVVRAHGVNERISVKNYAQVVEFYLDLIQSSCLSARSVL
jgi:carboxypeptidase PM20D1